MSMMMSMMSMMMISMMSINNVNDDDVNDDYAIEYVNDDVNDVDDANNNDCDQDDVLQTLSLCHCPFNIPHFFSDIIWHLVCRPTQQGLIVMLFLHCVFADEHTFTSPKILPEAKDLQL